MRLSTTSPLCTTSADLPARCSTSAAGFTGEGDAMQSQDDCMHCREGWMRAYCTKGRTRYLRCTHCGATGKQSLPESRRRHSLPTVGKHTMTMPPACGQ